MSGIDQVIARARQGDVGFSERKQFKLARRRAIEKLRRFALADPYFYVLEIIQGAIAGGADYVDIVCSDGDVLISWTGASLSADELAQLFDFLFASKDRLDLAHVRSLALGVNALLLFEPSEVVIESGDGSEGGTARMVVRAGADQVDVGRAAGTLEGTYVRATSLDRDKVARETGRRGGDDGGLEYATVESRCLAAPIPLMFNSHSLFGWSRQRVPSVYGYARILSFDEGDLYGTIGLKPTGGEPGFQILTQGVWIQSYQHELIPGHKLGGIVCFDRLHKTVDHSGFVRDDRFEEMWVRLRPYAEALVSGKQTVTAKISGVDGLSYTTAELRAFLQEQPRVVVVPEDTGNETLDEVVAWRGKSIAKMLDAQILRVSEDQISAIRVLGGRDLQIWRPHVRDHRDQGFYAEAPLEPPAPPYLLPPVELEVPTLDSLVEQLVTHGVQLSPAAGASEAQRAAQRGQAWTAILDGLSGEDMLVAEARAGEPLARISAQLRVMISATGAIRATLYSPVDPGAAARGLLVRVTSTGRLLGHQLFASAYPGRVLDVELPTAQPTALRSQNLHTRLAERFAALAVPLLREQDQRALAGLGVGKIEPDTPAARLALQVLSRVTVTRLRGARPGRLAPGLSLSLLRPSKGFDPFSLPLLRTLAGTPVSLRELALLTDETAGLVYGAVPEVEADLDGLDLDRILALDAWTERTLIGLLGEAGYVRVDGRDVLAEHEGVRVRDVALGLRDYPDFPALIEPRPGVATPSASDEALLRALVEGLVRRVLGQADEPGADPRELEEHRRQAVRQLQWCACRALARGEVQTLEALGLLDFPLFLDLDGEVWGLRAVVEALRSAEGLLVHYGHLLGAAELGALSSAALRQRQAPGGRPSSLAVSAFSHRLLAPLGRLRLAFDFDLDDVEAARNPTTAGVAFLVREPFESRWGTGVLGIPATRLAEYRIQLRARGREAIAALDELAHVYGVVGSIEVDERGWSEDTVELVLGAIDEQAGALLDQLIGRLAEFGDDPRRQEAALRVLLTYAGEQLTLIADGVNLSIQVSTPLAQRILGLALFDTGAVTLVSAHRLLDHFRRSCEQRYAVGEPAPRVDWSTVLAPGQPQLVLDWLETHLDPARVIMPASAPARGAGPRTAASPAALATDEHRSWAAGEHLSLDALGWNLEHWLAQLRPDPRDWGQRPLAPTRVWIVDHELASGHMFDGSDGRLELHGGHPLVERALAEPTARNLAWLLFAAYGYLNAMTGMITNEHESRFQLALGEALASGRLRVLAPPPGGSASRPEKIAPRPTARP